MSGLPRGERSEVRIKEDADTDWEDVTEDDYREVEVFDHVSVVQEHYVNSVNGYETFTGKIARGDDSHGTPPQAVTERVARLLWSEFSIDLDADQYDHIEVVDIESDEVWVA